MYLLKSDFGISQELLIKEPAEEDIQAGNRETGVQRGAEVRRSHRDRA